jgi:hypothetical protein
MEFYIFGQPLTAAQMESNIRVSYLPEREQHAKTKDKNEGYKPAGRKYRGTRYFLVLVFRRSYSLRFYSSLGHG